MGPGLNVLGYDAYWKPKGRALWISTVARAADARGIARAYWYFDGGFGVYDTTKDAWIPLILKALVPGTRISAKP